MKKLFTLLFILLTTHTFSQQYLSVHLFRDSNLMDGALVLYDDTYNDGVDLFDNRKLSNPLDNISINNGGTLLAIEKRKTYQTVSYHTELKDTTSHYYIKIKSTRLCYFNGKTPVIDSLEVAITCNFFISYPKPLSIQQNQPHIPPVRSIQPRQYIIYNLAGQYLGKQFLAPNGLYLRVNDKTFIKL